MNSNAGWNVSFNKETQSMEANITPDRLKDLEGIAAQLSNQIASMEQDIILNKMSTDALKKIKLVISDIIRKRQKNELQR